MVSNRDEKVSKNEQERINELPDPILGKILSYLPTKNAVAASILSTRWKNIFPFELPVFNINLDNSLLLHPKENESEFVSTSFIDFVDKLLNETLPLVDTFTLKCEKEFDEDKVISWICAIVRLSVRELELKCYMKNTYTLFSSLIGCTTSTRLELNGDPYGGTIVTQVGANFSLPSLISLNLISIIFEYDYYQESSQECTLIAFINGCPSLEELYLIDCNLEGIKNLHIISPVIKTLGIHDSLLNSDLIINIPNLELLSLSNTCGHNYWIYPLNSLRSGHVDGESMYYYESVTNLVYDCRKTRHLHLSLSLMEFSCYANKQFPEFQNLTRFDSVRSK